MSDIDQEDEGSFAYLGAQVIIEPEPIEASHLMSTQCVRCGKPTLAIAEKAREAHCGPCLAVLCGSGGLYAGMPEPVPARWVSERLATGFAEYWKKEKGKWIWVNDPVRSVESHPAAEVLGSWGEEMPEIAPAPVLKLAELAREASWDVRVSYARGFGIHGSTGRPTALRHVISVAFGRHPVRQEQAVATYVRAVSGGTWSWESVWLWGPEVKHFGLCALADLKVWLTDGLDLEEVRARVAGAENLKAQVKVRNVKIKKRHGEGASAAVLAKEYGLFEEDVLKIVKPARAKRESGG